MKNIICIIPARGGSKRIPRKNIKHFLGKPIIGYAIQKALEVNIFDDVIISTDDLEIAEISKEYGGNVPFYRSEKCSNDFATTADVIYEVLMRLKEDGVQLEYICCLYPTTPILSSERLSEAYKLVSSNEYDTVLTIQKFSYPIQRAFKRNQNGSLEWDRPEFELTRSQDVEPMYHDAGQFYFIKVNQFLENRKLIGSSTFGILIDDNEAQDIDNLSDWELAELKYMYMHKGK